MKKAFYIIMNLCLIFLFSCEENNILTNNGDSNFSGITRTNENGIILSDDLDDWQPRYKNFIDMVMDSVYLSPAYPNPSGKTEVLVNDTSRIGFILDFTAPQQAHILITLNNPNNLLYTIWDENAYAGHWQIFFDLSNKEKSILPNGIYRVYFNIKIGGSEYTTYGDIEINR